MLQANLKNDITRLFTENGRGLELEARFGNFRNGRFNSGVDRSVFNRVKAYFDKRAQSVNTLTTDYIMKDVRKTVDTKTQEVSWIKKERLWNNENRDYGIRYSMSRELPTASIADNLFKPDAVREKNRTSYLVFNNAVRIDITYVSMILGNNNETTFEIEIELMDYTKLDSFEKAVLVTLKLVQDTLFPYTHAQKESVINEINIMMGSDKRGYLDPKILVQARNLKLRDMVWGGLIGNEKTGYTVTHKTDGIRKLLFFTKSGVWLCAPNSISKVLDVEIPTLNGTILDGEMVPEEKRIGTNAPKTNIWFLAFDAISWNGNRDVQNNPHTERMLYAQTVADNIKTPLLTITTKSFKSFDTPIRFFEVMREMFREQLHLPYLQDGFMFTPSNSVYNPHSDKFPIYKRNLVDLPDICKWKPKDELTIDFLIKWRMVDTYKQIVLYSQKGRDLIEFKGNKIYPFDSNNVDSTNPLISNLPTNTVVEFGYDYEREILVPRRVRYDKSFPNSLDVAEDVWSDIMDPIDVKDLKGDTFVLLRKYHNNIKKKLFNTAIEKIGKDKKKYLLDIGSGYGGDLGKWRGFEKIVAVEPDPEHIAQLEQRLDSYGMRSRVKVVQAGGQETQKITEAVKEWIGDRVDVVSSMLSLTFFWQSPELVDSLVNTIMSNVKSDGMYIFLTMDGDLVEQTFNPASGTGLVLNKLKLGPATLEYFPDKVPQELYIDIEGTIVEKQREWLVRLDDLKIRMKKYGFNLSEIHRADEEKFLTEEEIIMTQMYTYGMFQVEGVPFWNVVNVSPSISLPPVSVPSPISLPPVSVPPVSVPPVSVPPVSVPPVSVPPVSLPPVSLPPVSLPPVSLPPVSLPPVSVPPVSVPPVSVPPVSVSPATKVSSIPSTPKNYVPVSVSAPPPLPPTTPLLTPSKLPPPLPTPTKLPLPLPTPTKLPEPVESQLPSLPQGMVEKVKVTWWDEPLVRIATIGNGDCFLHGVFTGCVRTYQISEDNNFRINFTRKFRDELADLLKEKDEVDPTKTKYETASGGMFVEMAEMQKQGLNMKDILGQTVDFSLEGLTKLLKSNEFLGDEVYSYVADTLGIDIFVMRITNKDLYPHTNTKKETDNRRTVIISGNGQHFETIGVERNGLYQTFFDPSDPLIKKILEFSKE